MNKKLELLHKIKLFVISITDNEPLDGDETALLAKYFLNELNKINGNK